MQGSFEKDVQGKMEELELTPSAPVWERIEVEIKAEKKKRRGLLWLLFAGLLLTAGIVYVSLNQKSTFLPSQIAKQKEGPAKRVEEKVKPAELTGNTLSHPTNGQEPAKHSNEEGAQIETNKTFFQTRTKATKQRDRITENEDPLSSQTSLETFHQLPFEKRKEENKNEKLSKKELSTSTPEHRNAVTTVADTQTVTSSPITLEKDSSTNKTEVNENPAIPKTDTAAKKKVASIGKWRKQLTVAAGMSSYALNYPSYKSLSNPLFYSAPGTTAAGSFYAKPSNVSSGMSYTLGIALAKKLSSRWEIYFGLQYSYASTHQKVGDKRSSDTAVQFSQDKTTANGYYTNTSANDYTNRFHFIELPVSVSFKASSQLPLYLSIGVAYGRLLSTNALTYSSTSNLYYQNKENYLRNTLPLFSLIQMEFLAHKTFSLRVGPYLQYNLIKAQKEAADGTPHLFSAGAKASLIF